MRVDSWNVYQKLKLAKSNPSRLDWWSAHFPVRGYSLRLYTWNGPIEKGPNLGNIKNTGRSDSLILGSLILKISDLARAVILKCMSHLKLKLVAGRKENYSPCFLGDA